MRKLGGTELEELGDWAGDVDVALRRGEAVDAGRHRLADRAEGARSAAEAAARAFGPRKGGRSIRPTRVQSQSASSISEPSTRKPSR